jgi:predicted O-methyltransferase YrrM
MTKKTYENRLDFLEKLNEISPLGKGVEIGVFKGQFSKDILSRWSGTLYMVDVWRPLGEEYEDASNHSAHINAYSETMENIKGLEKRAVMIRAESTKASEIFADESLDFVYIDGNHAYDFVVEDIKSWFPKLKKGGILSGHDYLDIDWYGDDAYAPNGKDKYIYINSVEEAFYAGIFGVNPAVDEFCRENNYELDVTCEWFGTWWIIK